MDLQRKLKLSKHLYISAKVIQAVFLFGYVFYLLGNEDKDAIMFTIIGSFILIGVLISYYILSKWADKIFKADSEYLNYYLIIFDVANFVTAVTTYPTAIKALGIKYKSKAEYYYSHHAEDTLGLKVNEIKRFPRDVKETNEIFTSDTIGEQIKNVTDALVENTFLFFGDLFSFVSMKSNSSEIINSSMENSLEIFNNIMEVNSSESLNSMKVNFSDINTSPNEINGTMTGTFHESSDQMFEDYYYTHITSRLIIPSIVCLLIQGVVAFLLGWIECVKYRIRKASIAQHQPIYEMNLMGDVDENDH